MNSLSHHLLSAWKATFLRMVRLRQSVKRRSAALSSGTDTFGEERQVLPEKCSAHWRERRSDRRRKKQVVGLSLIRWLIALLLVIECVGCAAFLEDYNYNPVGSTLSQQSNY